MIRTAISISMLDIALETKPKFEAAHEFSTKPCDWFCALGHLNKPIIKNATGQTVASERTVQ